MSSGASKTDNEKNLYEVRIFVEAEDEAELDSITDRLTEALCDSEHHEPSESCPNAWFIVSHIASAEEAKRWRPLLNR